MKIFGRKGKHRSVVRKPRRNADSNGPDSRTSDSSGAFYGSTGSKDSWLSDDGHDHGPNDTSSGGWGSDSGGGDGGGGD